MAKIGSQTQHPNQQHVSGGCRVWAGGWAGYGYTARTFELRQINSTCSVQSKQVHPQSHTCSVLKYQSIYTAARKFHNYANRITNVTSSPHCQHKIHVKISPFSFQGRSEGEGGAAGSCLLIFSILFNLSRGAAARQQQAPGQYSATGPSPARPASAGDISPRPSQPPGHPRPHCAAHWSPGLASQAGW